MRISLEISVDAIDFITLDYFLEEYYFKPSAIVSDSPGIFGGVNAVQQLRLVFAELGAPSIPSSFSIPRL